MRTTSFHRLASRNGRKEGEVEAGEENLKKKTDLFFDLIIIYNRPHFYTHL